MPTARREKLSVDDAQILRLECEAIKGHTGKLLVLAPDSDGRSASVARLRERVAERMGEFPRLTQRVAATDSQRLIVQPADVIDVKAMTAFAEGIAAVRSKIDILVAGVGGFAGGSLLETDLIAPREGVAKEEDT